FTGAQRIAGARVRVSAGEGRRLATRGASADLRAHWYPRARIGSVRRRQAPALPREHMVGDSRRVGVLAVHPENTCITASFANASWGAVFSRWAISPVRFARSSRLRSAPTPWAG